MEKYVDKEYCMSSFLALKFVADPTKIWKEGVVPRVPVSRPYSERVACATPEDMDRQIRQVLEEVDLSRAALLLSGGMDSGIMAAYMPEGMKAYTLHNKNHMNELEVQRAKRICELNHLQHVVVEVGWDDYENSVDSLMRFDGNPAHANVPQINAVVKRIAEDGYDIIVDGEGADTVFGGCDRDLAKDWTFEEWIERYSFVMPERVLCHPVDMTPAFAPYHTADNRVNVVQFLRNMLAVSSSLAHINRYEYYDIEPVQPFTTMKMRDPLDLARVRSGDSKYLVRALYRMKYPMLEVPEKLASPRAMDIWLKGWTGPKRPEFIPGCIDGLNYEQRYQVYILERFLNLIDA